MRRARFVVCASLMVGCGGAVKEDAGDMPPQREEVHGEVTGSVELITGDGMRYDTVSTPISLEVRLYPPRPHRKEITFADDIDATPIAVTRSSAEGRFSLRARPGRYTLLVIYEGVLLPRVYDRAGVWSRVDVAEGETVKRDIAVDLATY